MRKLVPAKCDITNHPLANVNSFQKFHEFLLYQNLFFLNFKSLLLKTSLTLIEVLALPDVFVWKWYIIFICILEFYLRELPETVCNFHSMKTPVELNSLLSKFFCHVIWFVIWTTMDDLQTRPLRQILLFPWNNSFTV